MKSCYYLFTVDGDLRIGDVEQQRAAIESLLRLLYEEGLAGEATWFINENDFAWTENHPSSLTEIVERGDAVGLHDHFDTHCIETYEDALPFAQRALQRLRRFLGDMDAGVEVLAHRSGCLHQRLPFYQVVRHLGYRIVSDVWPGMVWRGRMVPHRHRPFRWVEESEGAPLTENREVPLNGGWWRHDEGNWSDYRSEEGAFIQIPVVSFLLWNHYEQYERLKAAYMAAPEEVVLCSDIHPYDIQSDLTGAVDENALGLLRDTLRQIKADFSPQFMNVVRFAQMCEN